MKLMLGCVCREVTTALRIIVATRQNGMLGAGMIASYSQVGAGDARGYSGLSGVDMVSQLCLPEHGCIELWRDHASVAPPDAPNLSDRIRLDAATHFDGTMPDWSPMQEAYRTAYESFLSIELGHGEDPGSPGDGVSLKDYTTTMLQAQAAAVFSACEGSFPVSHVSGWLGTNLRDGRNSLDLPATKSQADVLGRFAADHGGLTIRAHNCDWLGRDHLRWLQDVGVTEFNFAPEIGLLATRVVLQAGASPGTCNALLSYVRSDGRYRRWHHADLEYGGHYALEFVRDRFPSGLSERMVDAIVAWTNERLDWLEN